MFISPYVGRTTRLIVAVMIMLTLVAACAKSEPTATPTATQTPVPPTPTSVPPTPTPVPPTATSPPPTAPPTPTPTTPPTPGPTTAPYEIISDVPYVPDGDPAQTLTLHLPETTGKQPLTLLVQGGEYMPDFVNHFAAQGYTVISFRSRDDGYRVEIQDTFCALAWVHANAGAYGLKNIVPVGGSMFGGNVALLGAVDDASPFLEGCPHPPLPETDRVRAVVALAGVFDYGEHEDFFSGFINNVSSFMGGAPDEVPEIWAEASAITWVDGSEPPFLLVHGTADVNVDAHQSEKFAAALQGAGVDAELVLLPGAGHRGILDSREAFAAVEAFLARLAAEEASAPFTGSGDGVIAFTSERDGNWDLYLMSVDDGGDGGVLSQRDALQSLSKERQLTHHPSDDYWSAWSPDGAHLAFASERDGDFDIYVMDVQLALQGAGDDAFLRQLTHSAADEMEPCWSPDGMHIAFMSNQAGRPTEIHVIDVDGGDEQRLTGDEGDDWLPAWSPDGMHIAFVSNRDGDDEIYVMNPDGSEQLPLTDNGVQDRYPAWSPDGAHITFSSGEGQERGLYVMSADGSDARLLTPGGASVWVSAWSPDGSRIAFTSDRDGNREIYVVNSDGSNLWQLTRNPGLDGIPAWQPSPAAAPPPPTTSTRPADGMVMLHVPGGEFDMGSTEAEIAAAREQCEQDLGNSAQCGRRAYNETPVHAVTLDSFLLDRTEVTNAQYALCVQDGACRPSRLANNAIYNGDDYPVAGIPWQDAADYCAWAGGRLPTEAEWEVAARGSGRRIYPWGDAFDCAGGNFNDDFTDCDDGYAHTAPVGSFPAGVSWCGALDMAGNVWEWVADRYGDYAAAPGLNPTGPAEGDLYVLRGGSWGYDRDGVRAAYRYPVAPSADYLGVGLRCAASPGE